MENTQIQEYQDLTKKRNSAKTYHIDTYGCQMNVADSELVEAILISEGYKKSIDINSADAIFVNTCAIREQAEEKIHSQLGRYNLIKRKKPEILIGVLGCMAQNLKDDLLENKPYIDIVLGPDSYRELPKILNQRKRILDSIVDTKLSRYEVYQDLFPHRKGGANAWVSIMRGCDKFCTFCIVPFTRGRERSRNLESILQEAKDAVDNGYSEITLLGQNVNSYNYQNLKFHDLLEEVSKIKNLKKEFVDISNRKTDIGVIPEVEDFNEDQFIAKEPITVILSEQGWVRTQKNHLEDTVELKYREGDKEKFRIHALSTDKIVFFADNGRVFSVSASKLPSGRGFGEPISLTIDLKADTKIISCFPFFDGNVIIASDTGHGFKTQTKSLIAQTKSGKQIINVKGENKAKLCKKIDGDTIAVVGNNRKLIVYSIKEIPELNKGKGVILQRYKDGTLSDIITFNLEDGISWKMNGGRQRVEKELITWQGKRGGAGKMVPNGFPKPPLF